MATEPNWGESIKVNARRFCHKMANERRRAKGLTEYKKPLIVWGAALLPDTGK